MVKMLSFVYFKTASEGINSGLKNFPMSKSYPIEVPKSVFQRMLFSKEAVKL